jgi:hypothetical protein
MLLAVLCSLLVAVGRPCRCLRRPPSLSSHFSIELEIEIVYNMYRMRRFYTKGRMRRLLCLGPPNYAINGTYKLGLDR